MSFEVFEVGGFDAFRFESRGQPVDIGDRSKFLKLLSGYARSKYPDMPNTLDDADVHIVYQSVAPRAHTNINNIPVRFPVGDLPYNTSRVFFAFYFPRDKIAVLLGGIHVCRVSKGSMSKKTLLKAGTPDIWLRHRNAPMPHIYTLYPQPVSEDVTRPDAMMAIEWRLSVLVLDEDSLINRIKRLRSKPEKIARALEWHQGLFTEDMRETDEYSYWLTLAASPTFTDTIKLWWQDAERWIIYIRACLLCKNEDDFDAVLDANTTSMGDIRQYGFVPAGPRRRGSAGPSDPWVRLPRTCPHPRFASLYSSHNRGMKIRKSKVEALAEGDRLLYGSLDTNELSVYFRRGFENERIDKVANKLGFSFGTTGFGDMGTLAVRFAPTRNVYEAPFEQALECVSTLKGVLHMGRIFIPWYMAYELIQAIFNDRCERACHVKMHERVYEIDHKDVAKQSLWIDRQLRITRILKAAQFRPKNMPTIWELENAMPPCMKAIMEKLREQRWIDNNLRYALVPFLFKLRYSLDTVMFFMERYWDPVKWKNGDARHEIPDLFKRYEKWAENPGGGKPYGVGCHGLAADGLCPMSVRVDHQELGRLYDQKVVDIEDCHDVADRCFNVMKWRNPSGRLSREKNAITSPQKFVYGVIKS
jgi:hypothetical protein